MKIYYSKNHFIPTFLKNSFNNQIVNSQGI